MLWREVWPSRRPEPRSEQGVVAAVGECLSCLLSKSVRERWHENHVALGCAATASLHMPVGAGTESVCAVDTQGRIRRRTAL